MISENISARIKMVSYLATTMVVFIHAGACSFNWFLDLITQWAVPWFLIVAGFFYHYSLERYRLKVLFKKVKTLLIPYLVWSVFGFLFAFCVDAKIVMNLLPEWFLVLGITQHPLYNQPLWFIRSLFFSMLILACAWTIGSHLFRSKEKIFWFTIVSFLLVFTIILKVRFFVEMPASPYYFLLGYIVGNAVDYFKFGVEVNNEKHIVIMILFPLVAMSLRFVDSLFCIDCVLIFSVLIRNITNLLMICAIWSFFSFALQACLSKSAINVSNYSFFVYCIHFPIVVLLVKLWRCYLSATRSSQLCMMFSITLLVVVACTILAISLKKYMPRFYHCLTGGRE